jgi:hypothetical protein
MTESLYLRLRRQVLDAAREKRGVRHLVDRVKGSLRAWKVKRHAEIFAHRCVHSYRHHDVHGGPDGKSDDSVRARCAPRPRAADAGHAAFEEMLLVVVKQVDEAARVRLFGGSLEGAWKHAVAVPE